MASRMRCRPKRRRLSRLAARYSGVQNPTISSNTRWPDLCSKTKSGTKTVCFSNITLFADHSPAIAAQYPNAERDSLPIESRIPRERRDVGVQAVGGTQSEQTLPTRETLVNHGFHLPTGTGEQRRHEFCEGYAVPPLRRTAVPPCLPQRGYWPIKLNLVLAIPLTLDGVHQARQLGVSQNRFEVLPRPHLHGNRIVQYSLALRDVVSSQPRLWRFATRKFAESVKLDHIGKQLALDVRPGYPQFFRDPGDLTRASSDSNNRSTCLNNGCLSAANRKTWRRSFAAHPLRSRSNSDFFVQHLIGNQSGIDTGLQAFEYLMSFAFAAMVQQTGNQKANRDIARHRVRTVKHDDRRPGVQPNQVFQHPQFFRSPVFNRLLPTSSHHHPPSQGIADRVVAKILPSKFRLRLATLVHVHPDHCRTIVVL